MIDIVEAKRQAPRDWFERSGYRCTYEQYLLCYCPTCTERDTCKHSGAFRRVPYIDGGLNLCPNLKE